MTKIIYGYLETNLTIVRFSIWYIFFELRYKELFKFDVLFYKVLI